MDIRPGGSDNPFMSTQTLNPPALDLAFARLVAEWRDATQFAANPSAAVTLPAYREMVALGPAVVPLILAALQAEPDPSWLAALRELTGADPVPVEDRGRTRAMAAHWLAWGHVHGLA